MSTVPRFQSADLRAATRDTKRDRDHAAKWRRAWNGFPADQSIVVTHEVDQFERPKAPP